MNTHRARFIARIEDGAIVIEDQRNGRSVTNDAELVIADLHERGFDLSLPVIYRDSLGRWDGLAVRGGHFTGFYPLNSATSSSYAEAWARLRTLQAAHDPCLGDACP